MSNAVISFLFAIGITAWVYNKFHRRTGGNQQTSVPAALVVGVIVFLITLAVLDRLS